jgi:hypothetical protein
LALGWLNVSKVPKIEFCFDLESTKKKCFEKRINVCKWLKNQYRYYSASFNDHFKPINKALALKTAELWPFDKLNSFYWILNTLKGQSRDCDCARHRDSNSSGGNVRTNGLMVK